jgi:hypothetical protein
VFFLFPLLSACYIDVSAIRPAASAISKCLN